MDAVVRGDRLRPRQSGLIVQCFAVALELGGIWASSAADLFYPRSLVSRIYSSIGCVLPRDLMSYSGLHFDYTVSQLPHRSSARQ